MGTRPRRQTRRRRCCSGGCKVQTHAPSSTQVVGFLTLVVSGAELLLLTGLTLIGAVVALNFLGPIALLTSPIWVPVAIVVAHEAATVRISMVTLIEKRMALEMGQFSGFFIH
ncbi:hypothetical protein DAI22_07g104900 [Oryza sativa Japonica Group]|nr:hypothetical protein DAI22_07g104900 [Oryza sativa Japonica Group]